MRIECAHEEGSTNEPQVKKYKLEVTFSNDMDLQDLYDDLISKGYLARIVK
jgi:hypothetical protein